MPHNENYDPMTKDNRIHAQVTKRDLEKREEINVLWQHHNIDGLNGEMLHCNMNEAQTLVDIMCNVNQTFRTEENFVNP